MSSFAMLLTRTLRYLQRRSITSLYVTGDKATENYIALQPYLDFEDAIRKKESIQKSMLYRNISDNMHQFLSYYKKYLQLTESITQINNERTELAKEFKAPENEEMSAEKLNELKIKGKELRNKLKLMKEELYPLEDSFVHIYLNLPNVLHDQCPTEMKEKILYYSPSLSKENADCHTTHVNRMKIIDEDRYYLENDAADFDLNCTYSLMDHLRNNGGFIQTANPDFVRAILLEANTIPRSQYHLVAEENNLNKLNSAFLSGGGAFESFLGNVTKLCVYPNVLPLSFVSCGRCYAKATENDITRLGLNLYTVTQTNCVQTFVATLEAKEANEKMEHILNLMIDFYKNLQLPFRIKYADASKLLLSESLRAVIEVYSPYKKQYIPIGYVSNYSDFISKRILFSTRNSKKYHFLYIIGGPVLYTSRLIGALIENDLPLNYKDTNLENKLKNTKNLVEDFRNIFK